MAEKAVQPADYARLRNYLMSSGIQKSNNPLYQIIEKLITANVQDSSGRIDELEAEITELISRIAGLGGGGGGAGLLASASYVITEANLLSGAVQPLCGPGIVLASYTKWFNSGYPSPP